MQPIAEILTSGLNDFIQEGHPGFPDLAVVPAFPDEERVVLEIQLENKDQEVDQEVLERVIAEGHMWVEWAMESLSGEKVPQGTLRKELADEFAEAVQENLNQVLQASKPGLPKVEVVASIDHDIYFFTAQLTEEPEGLDEQEVADLLDMSQFWVDKTVRYVEDRGREGDAPLDEEKEMEIHYRGLSFLLESRIAKRIQETYPGFPRVEVATFYNEEDGVFHNLELDNNSGEVEPDDAQEVLREAGKWLEEDLEKMADFFGSED